MKKIVLLFTFLSVLSFNQVSAQDFDFNKIDNVLSLLGGKDQSKTETILKSVLGELEQDAKVSKGQFGSKILSQIGGLSSMLPLLSKGKANLPVIQKALKVIKMLQGAQQLSALLKGGKLLGQGKSVLSNVAVLKSGLDLLNGGSAISKISKTLDLVTKKGAKLDKSGLGAKLAQKAVNKKLGSALSLLGGLI